MKGSAHHPREGISGVNQMSGYFRWKKRKNILEDKAWVAMMVGVNCWPAVEIMTKSDWWDCPVKILELNWLNQREVFEKRAFEKRVVEERI